MRMIDLYIHAQELKDEKRTETDILYNLNEGINMHHC
jgi:hypothetical protein